MMKVRRNYEGVEKVKTVCEGPSLTIQSAKAECDINNIMRKFREKGVLPEMIKTNPQYGDFSSVPDYQSACNTVIKAQEQFAGLSAQVRQRFANDPVEFLKFTADPANAEEMVRLGMAVKRPEGAVAASSSEGSATTPPSISKKSKASSTALKGGSK